MILFLGKDGRRISMDASKLSPQSLRRSLSTPPSSPARRLQNDEWFSPKNLDLPQKLRLLPQILP